MSTLGAQRTATTDLDVPMFAGWYADTILEAGDAPPVGASLMLTVADLSLLGTVIRSGLDFVGQPHAIVVGGAAWDLPLGSRTYQSDAGVRLATVLRDLLADVNAAAQAAGYARGEAYAALPADRSLGPIYDRPGSTDAAPQTGRAALLTMWRARVLPPWWIRGDGATVFGARPGGAATGRADITGRDSGVGLKIVGIDSPAGFLPGRTVEGATVRRLAARETSGSLNARAWT